MCAAHRRCLGCMAGVCCVLWVPVCTAGPSARQEMNQLQSKALYWGTAVSFPGAVSSPHPALHLLAL